MDGNLLEDIFMKRKFLTLLTWIGIVFLCGSCAEDNMLKPLENNPDAPGQVSNVSVENIKGGSILTYTLPSNPDLSYVTAEYTLPTGVKRTIKASAYTNKMTVDGFSVPGNYTVNLYAVNRSDVKSPALEVQVSPLESPIWDVFRSLTVDPAFGGIRLRAKNEDRANLGILIMEKNEYGEWIVNTGSVYTSTDSINQSLRGMDTVARDFAFTVRDRWLNYTDTLFAPIKPLYETAIPKSGYRGYPLPGDAPHHPSTNLSHMWDGDIMNWPRTYNTQAAVPGPHTLTFDLGVMAKLSRLVIWDYPEYYNGRSYYYLGNLKEFEIYGSDNPPADGSMNNWHLLGSYNATKPSGLPFGQQTSEDYELANAGFNWEIDPDAPKVRYIRIRSIKNWGGTTYMGVAEVQAYGDPR